MQKSMELHFEVRQTPDGDETRPYAVLALALNVPERFTVPEESGGVPVRGFGDFLRYEDARLREVHFPKKLRPVEF